MGPACGGGGIATNQGVNFGALIDHTCKQVPDTYAYPIWNQRW
ncbi:MAG: hypothetical protein ACP5P1_10605 [Acidimicrobiales bacterium]